MVSEELQPAVIVHHKQGMMIPEIANMLELQCVQVHRVVRWFQETGRQGPAANQEASNGKNPGAEIGHQRENQIKSIEKHEGGKACLRAQSLQLHHAATRERGSQGHSAQTSERTAAHGPNEGLQDGKVLQDEAAELRRSPELDYVHR